jgi:hypothetical protein
MKLRQLQVGLRPSGVDAQNLAAECDGVIEEALVGIQVDRPLVGAHGFGGIVDFEIEVADPVVERQVWGRFRPRLGLLDGFEIDFYGFSPVLFLLQLPRRVF